MALAHVRRDYHGTPLLESRSPKEPFALFQRWLRRALAADLVEPNAMSIATLDARRRPRVRMVLLKDASAAGFTFYTNTASDKGRELARHRDASAVIWWPELHQQVRLDGRVVPVSAAEADAYWAVRPRGAQLGAWASPQSRVLPSRRSLEQRLARVTARFEGRDVPRPPHWSGYRLVPRAIEFWQGRRDRLHDRLRYTRTTRGWRRERLAP